MRDSYKNSYYKFFTWDKSKSLNKLYTDRVKKKAKEMDSCAQTSEIIKKLIKPKESILDIGCGTGYLFCSLKKRINFDFQYFGIDANPNFVDIGNNELKKFKLKNPLKCVRVEDFSGKFDYVVCLNFLSYIDNYHKVLERLLLSAKKGIILRESLTKKSDYKYVVDKYLDKPIKLSVYVNSYNKEDFVNFIKSYGFSAKLVKDQRTGGNKELVIGYPQYWNFVIAKKKA